MAHEGGSCSRRALLRGLGVAALSPLAVNLLGGCQPGSSAPTANSSSCAGGLCIDLSDAANAPLASVGGAMLVDTSRDTLIAIRASESEVIALSAVCPHAGCTVDYEVSSQDLSCPCHGSRFAQNGSVLRGPARSPLHVYDATLSGTTITIAV